MALAKRALPKPLRSYLDGDALLEAPEDNPFLARFYADMRRFALPTQLNFLFQRVDQVRGLAQLDLFRRPTVADFLFDKDPLFARLNLSDDEFALYDKCIHHLKPQTPTPDLVIYLQAPVATLIERVHKRGVDYERCIPEHYLARLADAYSRYFYQYDDAPLLIVNSERLNFVTIRRPFRAAAFAYRGYARTARILQPGGTMTSTAAKRTVPGLATMAREGEKIAMLTCYDASFAALLEGAGVDALLVGDSLGMVIQGHTSTLPVTLDEMVYHTRCVAARARIQR